MAWIMAEIMVKRSLSAATGFPMSTKYQISTINNQQSTINNQQSTINNQQSTINNQQSTNNNQQFSKFGIMFIFGVITGLIGS